MSQRSVKKNIFDLYDIVINQILKKDVNHKKVGISKICEIWTVGDQQVVRFKYDFNDEFSELRVTNCHNGRPLDLLTYNLKPAYNKKLPNPALKLKDLLTLCKSMPIPFYKNCESDFSHKTNTFLYNKNIIV